MVTAVVYDPIFLEHNTGSHPENADRLVSTMQAIRESGLHSKLEMIKPRPATVDEVATVHTRSYIERVRRIAEAGGGYLDGDTYDSPGSYQAAMMAAGGTYMAMEEVLAGKADQAFALVRPPGHHAMASRGMGFCLFNNLAIATSLALSEHGIERVLIVDFDVHHGNGTQATFWRDSRVLYLSVHQYPFYPGSGGLEEIGDDEGLGYTINLPLPAGTGDRGYRKVFSDVVVPAARRFQPQIIAVSAGYDLHWADPIGGMQVTISGFAAMVEQLKSLAEELCQGRMVLALEGGYDLRALALSVVATLQVLIGEQFSDLLGKPQTLRSEASVDTIIQRARTIHGLP